jgi:hypothetical protein
MGACSISTPKDTDNNAVDGMITLGTPLANGASVDVRFLMGLQQTGNFKLYLNIEVLP